MLKRMMLERMMTKGDGIEDGARDGRVDAGLDFASSTSSTSQCREEPGAGRWSLIFPDELLLDAGIACRAHRRPTGLLHSCGEGFCGECLESEQRCPGCGETLPEESRGFGFCCA